MLCKCSLKISVPVLSVKNVNFRRVSFTYVNLKQEEEMRAEPVS